MQQQNKSKKTPFILIVLGIVLVSHFVSIFIHWIGIFIIAGLASYFFFKKSSKSLLGGFLAGFLLWFGYTLIDDIANGHHLTPKLAEVLNVPNAVAFMLITGLLGGLIGMAGAWFGTTLRNLFRKA